MPTRERKKGKTTTAAATAKKRERKTLPSGNRVEIN